LSQFVAKRHFNATEKVFRDEVARKIFPCQKFVVRYKHVFSPQQ
jgi:hypothetical protein